MCNVNKCKIYLLNCTSRFFFSAYSADQVAIYTWQLPCSIAFEIDESYETEKIIYPLVMHACVHIRTSSEDATAISVVQYSVHKKKTHKEKTRCTKHARFAFTKRLVTGVLLQFITFLNSVLILILKKMC